MKIFISLLCLLVCSIKFVDAAAVLNPEDHQAAQEAAIYQAAQQGQLPGPAFKHHAAVESHQMIDLPRVDDSQIAQVADISDVLGSLETSSRVWPLIADIESKIFIVMQYMRMFYQDGITIRHPPEHYVMMIDSMAQESPEMLNLPFMQIIQIAAILEYDFDNGQDRDLMARQILGSDEAWKANRQRLGF